MRGNTNANTSGGSGNVGNESALDLLIAQNTAKRDLATNLQGKGIEADAYTETLNQLVNKVPNILTDNSQTFPNNLTMNAKISGDYVYSSILIKNGYIFTVPAGSNIKSVYYFKISDIINLLQDNQSISISSIRYASNATANNIHNSGYDIGPTIVCNSDCTKLYVYSGSGYLCIFDIIWNGDDITNITLLSETKLDGGINIDISKNDNYLISTSHSPTGIYLYDIINSTNTRLSTTSFQADSTMIRWLGNDQFIICRLISSGNYYLNIQHYTIDTENKTISLIYQTQGTQPISNFNFRDMNHKSSIIEYDTNKYKVLIPLDHRGNNVILAIYDTYDRSLIEYGNNIVYNIETNVTGKNWPYYIDVKYDNINRLWLVLVGNYFFCFNDNFELINNIIINIYTNTSYFYGLLLWYNENKIMFLDLQLGTPRGFNIPYWFNKKILMKRTNSINEQSKITYYYADNVTQEDIEAGYYD